MATTNEDVYINEQGLATIWEKIKTTFVKPSDIPQAGNGQLTIKKNGVSVGTFTANQSSNAEVNITVPVGAAAEKGVDTSVVATSENLPTSKAVAAYVDAEIADQAGKTIAPLGADGLVPSAYLPSFVDDITEGYYSSGKFYKDATHSQELKAESGKIYVDLHTNKTYRWSGSAYVEISKSLAIGTTSGTAYDGASGAQNAADIAALQTSNANKVDKVSGKGLSTNDYTTAEKTKLANIAAGAEVNVQSDWNATDEGADAFIKNKPSFSTIVTSGGAITSAGSGLSKSGNTINHTNAITAQTESKYVAIKVDAQGHITAIGNSLRAMTTTEINAILV